MSRNMLAYLTEPNLQLLHGGRLSAMEDSRAAPDAHSIRG
jgi:hypothetical protein